VRRTVVTRPTISVTAVLTRLWRGRGRAGSADGIRTTS
jgi:hypothetical protein